MSGYVFDFGGSNQNVIGMSLKEAWHEQRGFVLWAMKKGIHHQRAGLFDALQDAGLIDKHGNWDEEVDMWDLKIDPKLRVKKCLCGCDTSTTCGECSDCTCDIDNSTICHNAACANVDSDSVDSDGYWVKRHRCDNCGERYDGFDSLHNGNFCVPKEKECENCGELVEDCECGEHADDDSY